MAHKELTDEQALEYMHFAARLSTFRFKTDEEMLQFKADFQAALAFIDKLEEVDVSRGFHETHSIRSKGSSPSAACWSFTAETNR